MFTENHFTSTKARKYRGLTLKFSVYRNTVFNLSKNQVFFVIKLNEQNPKVSYVPQFSNIVLNFYSLQIRENYGSNLNLENKFRQNIWYFKSELLLLRVKMMLRKPAKSHTLFSIYGSELVMRRIGICHILYLC